MLRRRTLGIWHPQNFEFLHAWPQDSKRPPAKYVNFQGCANHSLGRGKVAIPFQMRWKTSSDEHCVGGESPSTIPEKMLGPNATCKPQNLKHPVSKPGKLQDFFPQNHESPFFWPFERSGATVFSGTVLRLLAIVQRHTTWYCWNCRNCKLMQAYFLDFLNGNSIPSSLSGLRHATCIFPCLQTTDYLRWISQKFVSNRNSSRPFLHSISMPLAKKNKASAPFCFKVSISRPSFSYPSAPASRPKASDWKTRDYNTGS